MSRHGQRGEFTLIGLMVAMTLFIIVLGSTLDVFNNSERLNRDIQQRNDAMDRARVALDRLARQLRNMASPTPNQPQSIDRATGRDVVFQTVDPVGPNAGANTSNVKRVRYCVDGSGQLWTQNQRWTTAVAPAVPSDGGTQTTAGTCPSNAWTTSTGAVDKVVLADSVTNYAAGQSRDAFTFTPSSPLTSITQVHADLWLDLDFAKGPAETQLSSGVFLRNQNRSPTATLSATSSTLGIKLNGSGSSDPEDDSLAYCWYDTALATLSTPPSPCPAGRFLGSGVTILDAAPAGATRQVYLIVVDPGGLSSQTATTTVTN